MPFAVFRRHQRKLLAVLAILAMFTFVVADSLPRLLNGNPQSGGNPVVVTLYGNPIRRAALNAMAAERSNANLFVGELIGLTMGQQAPFVFGDLQTRSLVDALILQHEADRLKMPAGPEIGRQWLKKLFGPKLTRDLFEILLSRFNNRISGEELLSNIANQVRLRNVRQLLGSALVTPLDVFQTYRDQNERISARAVAYRVEDYLTKTRSPSDSELVAFFEKYKNSLPDPNRPTPGFKVPRQIQVEILSVDGEALARSLKEKLTESELLSYYENRKLEFKKPSEFPDEIFEGDTGGKTFTPPIVPPFSEVRSNLAISLADEKAQTDINNRFNRVKDELMIPFADRYLEVADEIAEAKKQGTAPQTALPQPEILKTNADKEKLDHEISPLLNRDRAETYGAISRAEVGTTRLSGGRKFVEELFESKSALFEPIELTDPNNRRYLIRKLQDLPPRVPSLKEIEPEVVHAWRIDQARPLARKAAETFAATLKASGGKIKGEIVDGHPVITTGNVARLQPGFPLPGQFFQSGPPTPSEIPQFPAAGPALRDAYFNLTEGTVAVAPDQPEKVYYVLTLNERIPATFEALYAPNGDYFRYKNEALMEAEKKRDSAWMAQLRAEAGLQPDWSPADETKNSEELASNAP
ncbi:MAG: hypothetical protein NVSMB9_03920 [Isosphaeraceae bacterium]